MPIIFTSPQRSKRKKNPTAAQRKLAEEWEKLVTLHSKPLEKGAHTQHNSTPEKLVLDLGRPAGRADLGQYPSRVTPGGDAVVRKNTQYTGDKILGIGTMHKSSSVPVFSSQEVVDISTMRRN
jgi:hypothetical protein